MQNYTTTQNVLDLNSVADRVEFLTYIANMAANGYMTEALSNKGSIVPILKHDLSSAIRAVQLIDKIVSGESQAQSKQVFNLNISPMSTKE